MNKYEWKYLSTLGKSSSGVITIVKRFLSIDDKLVNLLYMRVKLYLKYKGGVNNE